EVTDAAHRRVDRALDDANQDALAAFLAVLPGGAAVSAARTSRQLRGLSRRVDALAASLRESRARQAEDFAGLVVEDAGLTAEDLTRALADRAVAEVVETVLPAAQVTRSQDKLKLLARVAAAALRGDD